MALRCMFAALYISAEIFVDHLGIHSLSISLGNIERINTTIIIIDARLGLHYITVCILNIMNEIGNNFPDRMKTFRNLPFIRSFSFNHIYQL